MSVFRRFFAGPLKIPIRTGREARQGQGTHSRISRAEIRRRAARRGVQSSAIFARLVDGGFGVIAGARVQRAAWFGQKHAGDLRVSHEPGRVDRACPAHGADPFFVRAGLAYHRLSASGDL